MIILKLLTIFANDLEHIKKERHYFVNKGPSSQGYGFSSSHVWTWELDYKKAERQRIDVLFFFFF